MHERTNEMDGLRRLADLLRQAMTAATEVVPGTKKQPPRIRKLQRSDTAIAPDPHSESRADAPRAG